MGRLASLIACIAAAALACSCAAPFRLQSARLEVRPVPLDQPATTTRSPAYYAAAVAAIDARDYVRALDLLQDARAEKADDPAVLNAFGVVYDKLGRLDLSARYYAQARQIDPASKIIQHNMAYSEQLRAHSNEPQAVEAAVAPAAPAPMVTPVRMAAARPALRVRVAGNGVLLIGGGVRVADASGAQLGEQVRTHLAARGWTLAKASPPRRPVQAKSTLTYPQGGAPVALALARSLHTPVQMSACQPDCGQITLIIGQDARRSRTDRGA